MFSGISVNNEKERLFYRETGLFLCFPRFERNEVVVSMRSVSYKSMRLGRGFLATFSLLQFFCVPVYEHLRAFRFDGTP